MSPPDPLVSLPRPEPEFRHLSGLCRDSGCCLDLNWRCELAPGSDRAGFQESLLADGYELRCNHSALRVLRHADGHELAWVLTSGRLQIRVGIDVEPEEREAAARDIHHRLVRSLEETAAEDRQGFALERGRYPRAAPIRSQSGREA